MCFVTTCFLKIFVWYGQAIMPAVTLRVCVHVLALLDIDKTHAHKLWLLELCNLCFRLHQSWSVTVRL